MDDLIEFNKARWEALAAAGIAYSRPMLDLDEAAARRVVDPRGLLGNVAGKEALCLAGGGGQQSAALLVLGAEVTVFDLSESQLAGDQAAAARYGRAIRTVQGDMRDLSALATDAFDVVWQPYSINFVPDPLNVFQEVVRVLRPGGLYCLDCANPFLASLSEEEWDGRGYPLYVPYGDGELHFEDTHWDVQTPDGSRLRIEGPREFRHTLSTLVNGLLALRFRLLGLWEADEGDADATAAPGSWPHFQAVAPPYLQLWLAYEPEPVSQP